MSSVALDNSPNSRTSHPPLSRPDGGTQRRRWGQARIREAWVAAALLTLSFIFTLTPLIAAEVAVSEVALAGSLVSGDYRATQAADGSFEVLQEQLATVGPPPKRADLLEWIWSFQVPAPGFHQLVVKAHRIDAGGEGDDFRFFYSLDGGNSWVATVTVSNSAPESPLVFPLPASLSGEVRLRVIDLDRSAAHQNQAQLWVDYLGIEATSSPPPEPPPPYHVSGPRIVGYYTSWSIYGREYYVNEHEAGVDSIPAEWVTHINYAFANLQQDGTVIVGDEFADINKIFGNEPPGAPFKGNFQQLKILKERFPHIKTLLSVGGWTWSDHFSDVMANDPFPNSRQNFCSSLLNMVQTYGFDGADINWEHPGDPGEGDNSYRPEDGQNFVDALALCKGMFEAADKLLTAAGACSPVIYEQNMQLGDMIPYLDWINLMAYDLHGAWDPVTAHHSQLYPHQSDPFGAARLSLAECVQGYLDLGVPPDKLNAGIPTYGRSYARVADGRGGDSPGVRGLFQLFEGVPKGTWDGGKWGVTGIFDYQDVHDNLLPVGVDQFDPTAGIATLTWPLGRKLGLGFLSYDDPRSVCMKTEYALDSMLGGVMFWEFSADLEDHPDSLIRSMFCGLNPDFEECASACSR